MFKPSGTSFSYHDIIDEQRGTLKSYAQKTNYFGGTASVVALPNGRFYALRSNNGQLHEFHGSGKFIATRAMEPKAIVLGVAHRDHMLYCAQQFGSNVERIAEYAPFAYVDDIVAKGASPLNEAYDVTFSPHDGSMVVASNDGQILRYDPDTGEFLGHLAANTGLPRQAVFGPDGHLYVASNSRQRVAKYNGTTGAYIGYATPPLSYSLRSIGFGPEGYL